MTKPNPRVLHAAAVLFALGVSACSQASAPDPMSVESHHAAAGASQHRHDDAMMQRHASEAKQMEERVGAHLRQMRGLSGAQQHARMGEHVSTVGGMISMMDRHMREMGMGANHGHMGPMMGMGAAQHEKMMKEMQALRGELEQLQTLSVTEVARRMAAHLTRVEGMLPMLRLCSGHEQHNH